MKNTIEDIQKAISNLEKKVGAKITRHCRGYIIMAQDERDFEGKKNRITRGDIKGFYTVYNAARLN
mgnify:CR=1 FL=1|tara:strand:- start:257 stop:454 length:198 start_codon:yes stop_codon:yes gene_type:complete